MNKVPDQTSARRIADLTEWLRENAPYIVDAQKHLDEGTTERAYWHYGYLSALRDLQALEAKGTDSAR